MNKTLRRHATGYALSFLLLFFGMATLSYALWITWPKASQKEYPLANLWTTLSTEKLKVTPTIQIPLTHIVLASIAMIIAGLAVFALSRQWLPLGGKNSIVQCPFCNNRWRTSPDKALGLCPHCRQLVHPKLVDG